MSFNDRIKEARIISGYTQEQLGNKVGVAKSTIAGYEKNREPDVATLGAIMEVLEIDANFLFQDEMRESNSFTFSEIDHIKKYRDLDEHGKEIVDTVLELEHKRHAE